MDRSSIILSIALFALFASYFLFTNATYLSELRIVELNLLGLASAILFFMAYVQRGNEIWKKLRIAQYAIAAIALFYLFIGFQLIGLAVIVSVLALELTRLLSRRLKSYVFCAMVIATLVAASLLSYAAIASVRSPAWNNIDEIAFNYYASYLTVHGQNPYSKSMQPVLTKYGTQPTHLLNGSTEKSYDYPAFSFIPVLAVGLLNLKTFTVFASIMVFIITVIAFLAYQGSRYRNAALVPIAVWLLITYLYVATIDQYIAIGILLLLSYTMRRNMLASSILLGLAASTMQIAWFAIPFMFVLRLREDGKSSLLKSIAISAITFLAVNAYFIATAPAAFSNNIFGLLHTSNLIPSGLTLPQALLNAYPTQMWYPAAISIIVILVLIVLFYIYTDTLKPIIAIAPAFIFFLSWRNTLLYQLPFIPLLIILCYEKADRKNPKDLVKGRKYILLAFAGVIILAALIALYAHAQYKRANTIVVNSAVPMTSRNPNNTHEIKSITLNVTNNGKSYENVTFILITDKPKAEGLYPAANNTAIPPFSSKSYTLAYNAYTDSSSARLYVMAFSKDYIVGDIFNISLNTSD